MINFMIVLNKILVFIIAVFLLVLQLVSNHPNLLSVAFYTFKSVECVSLPWTHPLSQTVNMFTNIQTYEKKHILSDLKNSINER